MHEYAAGSLGGHGNDYQRQLAWMLLQRSTLRGRDFRLAFEMEEAGKFDDIGLSLNGGATWYLIQTKHTQGSAKQISKEALYDRQEGGDFALLKYVKSYRKMRWSYGSVERVVIFSNREFDDSKFGAGSYEEVDLDEILVFSKGNRIRLKNQEEEIVNMLKEEAFKRDLGKIRDAMIGLFKQKRMDSILEKYHTFLKGDLLTSDGIRVFFTDQNQITNVQVKKLGQDLLEKFGSEYFRSLSVSNTTMGSFWAGKDLSREFGKNLENKFNRDSKMICQALIELFVGRKMHPILETYKCILRNLFLRDGEATKFREKQDLSANLQKLYDSVRNSIASELFKSLSVFKGDMAGFWDLTEDLVEPEVDRVTVGEFFSKLVLAVAQPSVDQLRQDMIDEGRQWVRSWIRPDDLGRMEGGFFELPLGVIRGEFDGYERHFKCEEGKERSVKKKEFIGREDGERILRKIEQVLREHVRKSSKRSCTSLEATEYYYINRQIDVIGLANMSSISDEAFVQQLYTNFDDRKCFVLTAQPGMGKSTLWQYLAFEAQKFHPTVAVFLVYLNNIQGVVPAMSTLQDLRKSNVFKADISGDNVELIANDQSSRVILFLDAFDELSEKNQISVLKLVTLLLKRRNIKIVISGRRHVKESLETTLDVISMDVQAFSKDEQITFLEKFWCNTTRNPSKFAEFSRKILDKFHADISRKEYDFTGVPLMIRMVAEIFAGPFEKYSTSDVAFKELVPAEKFSVIGLYDQFARKCVNITMNKKYNADNNSEPDSLFDPVQKALDYNYQVLAASMIFSVYIIPYLTTRSYHETLHSVTANPEKQHSLMMEVVGTDLRFSHLTFAEYFAAKYLFGFAGHMAAIFCSKEISDCFKRHENVCNFFLAMVNSQIVLDFENLSSSLHNLTKAHKFRLNLLAALGTDILLWSCQRDYPNILKFFCNSLPNLENLRDHAGKTLLELTAEHEAHRCDRILVEHFRRCAVNPLHYAVKSDRLDVAKSLVNDGADLGSIDGEGSTALFVVKSVEMIDYLIESGANLSVKNHNKDTVLHNAVRTGEVRLVSKIIDQDGALLNDQNDQGQSALHVASAHGKVELVRLLCNRGANVTLKANDGSTAYCLAVENCHPKVVRYFSNELNLPPSRKYRIDDLQKLSLLAQAKDINQRESEIVETRLLIGFDVNAKTADGNTALHDMARTGASEIVEKLLQNGATVSERNNAGETPLHVAIYNGKYHVAKLLVTCGADIDYGARDCAGNTVLHAAAMERSDGELVRLLAEKVRELDGENNGGKSALSVAVDEGSLRNVRILLEAGASPAKILSGESCTDGHERSAQIFDCLIAKASRSMLTDDGLVRIAAGLGCVNSLRKLVETGLRVDSVALRVAVLKDHPAVVNLLLDSLTSADCEICDEEGRSLLHIAVERNNREIVKILTAKTQIDLNGSDNRGRTALHYLQEKSMFDVLISAGADDRLNDDDGNTGLHFAAQNNCRQLVQFIVDERGFSVDCANNFGKTALHIAAECGFVEIVELLVSSKANHSLTDNDGKTALSYAIEKGRIEVVCFLRNYSQEIDLKTYEDQLHLVAAEPWDEYNKLKVLLQLGVNVNAFDQFGKTPLHIAASSINFDRMHDNTNFIKILIEAGADVDLYDRKGNSPLHLAINRGMPLDIIGILADFSSYKDHKNTHGETPLHLSIRQNNAATKLLIAKNVCLHLADRAGNTPLHQKIPNVDDSHSRELALLLIDLLDAPELNRQNHKGETALHRAVARNDPALVRALIKKGVDSGLKTKQCKTAYDLTKDELIKEENHPAQGQSLWEIALSQMDENRERNREEIAECLKSQMRIDRDEAKIDFDYDWLKLMILVVLTIVAAIMFLAALFGYI